MNYKKQNMANEDNYSGTQAHLATSIVEANSNASLTGNPVQQSLARRLIIAPIKEKKEKLNDYLGKYSLIGNPDIFDPSDFPWTEDLSSHLEEIQKEMADLLKNKDDLPPIGTISPDHRRLDNQRSWRVFFLWGYGVRFKENCSRCPQTAALVDKIPNILSAFFSVHEPGTHLPEHNGPSKCIITCHLPLKTPSTDAEGCRICINGKNYVWEEGKWLIFDDTYDHEVWNDSGEDRINLLLHVKRPMRGFGNLFSKFFFKAILKTPFFRETFENLDEWNAAVKKQSS